MEKRKDRHVGLGIFANYVPSTGRLKDGFKKTSQVLLSRFTSHPHLVVLITVSPYWYIRGATPHRRIRRW
jgi:hypothetical protein